MSSESPVPLVGQILDGRYEIVRLLGRGAMGSVYLARQVRLDRPVAVKVLNPDLPVHARARRRLHREARAVGRISHPNVVQVHDYGQTAAGSPYLVMEYIKGCLPGELVARSELAQVLAVVDGVLAGLGAAHDRGVLHRDLKPANMMLRGGDPSSVVLLDFGIAAILGADDPRWSLPPQEACDDTRITQDGAVMGTPLYMSPEQARGNAVTERSDLYSVGVILYHWLAGRPPFQGRVREVMRAHVFDPAPPITPRSGLMVPGPVVRVLEQALAKDPARRFASAADMREAIALALHLDPLARPAPVPAPTVAATPPRAEGSRQVAPLPSGSVPGEPPFVGREDEVAALGAHLASAVAGRGAIVRVEGPEGIGKTRLVEQVLAESRPDRRLLVGRAAATPGDAAPLQLVRTAVSDLLRCRSLSPSGLLDRLADTLGGGEAALTAPERSRLASWLRGQRPAADPQGPPSPPEWQEQALVERALRVVSEQGTVVLWLDDVQWADPATGAFLARLAITLSLDPLPLLVVVTRAPTDGPAPDDGLVRYLGRSVHRVAVSRLPSAALQRLVVGLLPLEVSTATRLARRADGSPLYAVQLVRHLVERELLRRRHDLWTLVHTSGPGDLLPASLEQILTERLEIALAEGGHPEATERVLEAAAVLGSTFDFQLLARVLDASGGAIGDDLLDEVVDHLVRRDLFTEPGGSSDRLGWSRRLLRELTLVRMGRSRRRRRLCRAAADGLLASSSADERLARPVVDLLLVAGDRQRAAEHALAAGREALASADLAEAVRFFELARSQDSPASSRQALWELGRVENRLGHTDRAEDCYRAILGLEPGGLDQGRAWFGIGQCRYNRGEHPQALEALERAQALFTPSEDSESALGYSRVLRTLAAVAAELPGVPIPDPDVGRLLELADGHWHRFHHLTTAGFLAYRRGDLGPAIGWWEQARAEARGFGEHPDRINLLVDLGRACRTVGDREAAERYLEEGLRLAQHSGQRRTVADLRNERGELARSRGDLTTAASEYRQAVRLWALVGSPYQLLGSLNLALVAVEDERPEEALAALDGLDGEEVAPRHRAALLLTRALALAAAGRHDEAVSSMEDGAGLQGTLPPPHDEAVDVLDRLARAWRQDRGSLADRAAALGSELPTR
jgi:eukaryotic-like serine/threonine-protein kinase